jgi:hypothetical protein
LSPHSQRPGAKGEFGRAGLQLLGEPFTIWHAFQAADHPRARLAERMASLSRAFGALIEMGLEDPDLHTSRFAREISKLDGALWTYTHTDGVQPSCPSRPTTRPASSTFWSVPRRTARLGFGVLDTARSQLHRHGVPSRKAKVAANGRRESRKIGWPPMPAIRS